MTRYLMLILALGFLASCGDGNPLGNDDDDETETEQETEGDEGEPIDSTRELPPGTASPTPNNSLFRSEAQDTTSGSGFLTAPTYDSVTDTFTAPNLPFDGDSSYRRGQQVSSLGAFAVYENENIVIDPQTGNPVTQFLHKALYAVSDSGRTEMAIVRTGAYADYGFGGFIYQRNGSVSLPTGGQAVYRGDYAGLRDFDGRGGIEYVSGDAEIRIDFDAFENGAIAGDITNRTIFDIAGNDITQGFLDAMAEEFDTSFAVLPTLSFNISSDALDANGEATGTLDSEFVDSDGGLEVLEDGSFYAVLAGPGATEVAGVIVVTADDPRFEGVTVRETGGFIATR